MLAAAAAVTFVLIAAVQAPTVYFYRSVPEPRAQSLSAFTLLAGLAFMGWTSGRWIARAGRARIWLQVAAVLGILCCAAYTARLAINHGADLRTFETRARLWDQRDAALRSARAQGVGRVNAIAIDTRGWGVEDMLIPGKQMNGQWVSNCFSQDYGLQAVRAVPP
jgi:hypothetical protein